MYIWQHEWRLKNNFYWEEWETEWDPYKPEALLVVCIRAHKAVTCFSRSVGTPETHTRDTHRRVTPRTVRGTETRFADERDRQTKQERGFGWMDKQDYLKLLHLGPCVRTLPSGGEGGKLIKNWNTNGYQDSWTWLNSQSIHLSYDNPWSLGSKWMEFRMASLNAWMAEIKSKIFSKEVYFITFWSQRQYKSQWCLVNWGFHNIKDKIDLIYFISV